MSPSLRALALSLITAAVCASSTYAATLPAWEDTTSSNGKVTKSANNATTLGVNGSPKLTKKALLYFNLDDVPTTDATKIRSASLRIYVATVTKPGPLAVRKVTGSWDEATTVTVPEPSTDGTTIATFDAVFGGSKDFISVDVTNIVKAWITTPADNQGFVLVPGNSVVNVLLGSKEGAGNGHPAELDIELLPPPIAAGSVGTNELGSGSVTTAKLFAGSVTTTELGGGSVTSAKLASGLTLGGTTTLSGSLNLPTTANFGSGTIAQGGNSLLHTFGSKNFFAGIAAGNFTMSGIQNTATGYRALNSNTSGTNNTAIGMDALVFNTAGGSNTGIGESALRANTEGTYNTGTGAGALSKNTTGGFNTGSGGNVLRDNIGGIGNTATGFGTLLQNIGGSYNIAIGFNTLYSNISGSGNIAIGPDAGNAYSTESNNISLSAIGVPGDSGVIRIGRPGTHNLTILPGKIAIGSESSGATVRINHISNVAAPIDSAFEIVKNEASSIILVRTFSAGGPFNFELQEGNAYKPGGGAWAVSSDRRLKKDIEPLAGALDRLMKLRSVTYQYKDPEKTHQFPGTQIGFIAQEVEEVFPEWVSENSDGYKTLAIRSFESLTVQSLRELRAESDAKIARLTEENKTLAAKLAALEARDQAREARLTRLENSLGNSAPRAVRATLDLK